MTPTQIAAACGLAIGVLIPLPFIIWLAFQIRRVEERIAILEQDIDTARVCRIGDGGQIYETNIRRTYHL